MAAFLFLAMRRVINFASVIQAAYNVLRLHGVMGHGRVQIFLLSKLRAKIGAWSYSRAAWIFAGPLASVSELESMDPKCVGSKAAHRANT